jgi:SEC-C motif-containing protein
MMPTMNACPCGSNAPYDDCCGPYLAGWDHPATAEALMRSRYTAYARADIDYLESTSAGEASAEFSRKSATAWARAATFTRLEVHATEAGGPDDERGVVEFSATYVEAGKTQTLRERSRFERRDGAWRYLGRVKEAPTTREAPRVGRNDPCPCGSGLKYKKCHG